MRDGALVVAHPVRQHLLDFAFDEEQPTTGRPDFWIVADSIVSSRTPQRAKQWCAPAAPDGM